MAGHFPKEIDNKEDIRKTFWEKDFSYVPKHHCLFIFKQNQIFLL